METPKLRELPPNHAEIARKARERIQKMIASTVLPKINKIEE